MKYKIKSTKSVHDTLFTEVEYTLDNGTIVTRSIPHFQPQTKEDVIVGIENRFASEQIKNAAELKVVEIITELEEDIDVEVIK